MITGWPVWSIKRALCASTVFILKSPVFVKISCCKTFCINFAGQSFSRSCGQILFLELLKAWEYCRPIQTRCNQTLLFVCLSLLSGLPPEMSDGSLDYETDILPWLYMLHVVNYFYFSVFITQNVLPHCFQKQLPFCIILLKLNCHGLLHVILLQGMALKYSMVV